MRDLFTKVLVNQKEKEDELYDWMKGQPAPVIYERRDEPIIKDTVQVDIHNDDKPGTMHQFISCISCGLFSCF